MIQPEGAPAVIRRAFLFSTAPLRNLILTPPALTGLRPPDVFARHA